MTTYDVFTPEEVRRDLGTEAVLASLPLSYAPAATAEGAVMLVDGGGDWPTALTSAWVSGARGAVVVHPCPVELDALAPLLRVDHPVVLDSPWASNPVVSDSRAALLSALDASSRVEARVTLRPGSDLRCGLLDQLTLVRALIGPVTDLDVVFCDENGYIVEGRAEGVAVDFAATCTVALPERADIRVLIPEGSVEVSIPAPETAQPALLAVTDAAGLHLRPTLFESGHRSTWRRLHALLLGGQPATDLAAFAADLATLVHTDLHHS